MEKRKDPPRHDRGRWWVVQQHDQVTMEEAAEAPSIEVEPGERMKRVRGPYKTKDEAKKVQDALEARTLGRLTGRL